MIKKFFQLLFSLMPDLTGFKEMGFQVKTFNGDLYVEKVTEHYKIRFSQSFEPFNPRMGDVVDFDIPDGVVLVEFLCNKKPVPQDMLEDLGQLFQNHHYKEPFFFLFNNKMDFGSPGINIKVKKLVETLDSYYH